MNLNEDPTLEKAVDRELKRLPELTAPRTLVPRVLARIERQASPRWYRRSWPTWSPALRAASLAVLLALFGGLCFGGWQWSESETVAAATRRIGGWFSQFGVAWETLRVLLTTAVLVAKQFGPAFIAACLVAAALSYAACVGLGTMVVRIALPRAGRIQL